MAVPTTIELVRCGDTFVEPANGHFYEDAGTGFEPEGNGPTIEVGESEGNDAALLAWRRENATEVEP